MGVQLHPGVGRKHLLDGVERAGADVAEHDSDGAERKARQHAMDIFEAELLGRLDRQSKAGKTAATVQLLAGTEGATLPFWSPDSTSLGFFSQGKLTCMDTIKSSVEIFYNNANCNSTWLIHNDSCNIEYPKGTGDITVIGQSTWGWIYSNALGKINGKNWICQNLSVHHNSLQNLYAHPVQYLHAELHNQGNLYIPFFPVTWDKSETAEGKLIIQP